MMRVVQDERLLSRMSHEPEKTIIVNDDTQRLCHAFRGRSQFAAWNRNLKAAVHASEAMNDEEVTGMNRTLNLDTT